MTPTMSAATLIQPSGEMWKKIREELNENVTTRDSYLANIKDWLKKQPHLPDSIDDQRIMTFLRGCKFSLEKTKRKLDMYFTMRAACPDFFTKRDIDNDPGLQELLAKGEGAPLPGLTPSGCRVLVARGIDKTLDPNYLNDVFKFAMMIADVRLQEELEGVAGDVYILDASLVMAAHLGKISFPTLKKFFICVQEAYPVKLKQIHVVNAHVVVDTLLNMIKPFLKEKLRNRIYSHTSLKTLHQHVPLELLPEEYGGTAGPLKVYNDAWIKKLSTYKSWFQAEEKLVANEALRPGKPKNYEELFGIEGSFRKLDID